MPLSESRLAVLAAARYWRATQAVKGVPTQAIEHAHRCLVRAVDAYAAELKRAETTLRERGTDG